MVKVTDLDVAQFSDQALVPVMRKFSADKRYAAYMMRASDHALQKLIPPSLERCTSEIEFCHRYLAGELRPTASMSMYGFQSGGGPSERVEERAIQILPKYDRWKAELYDYHPNILRIVNSVMLDGMTIRQARSRYNFMTFAMAANAILYGLNRYSIIRGWGDCLGEIAEYSPGYVYVIGQADQPPFKIGFSSNPARRLTDLQIGSPVALELKFLLKSRRFKDQALEADLHRHFKAVNVRGEWFNADLEHIKDVIRIMCPDGVEINPLDPLLRTDVR